MPINPNIPLSGAPLQFQSPLELYSQVQQVRGAQNQNALIELQLQQAQSAAMRESAIRQALSSSGEFDPAKIRSLLTQSGDWRGAMKFDQAQAGITKDATQAKVAQLDLEQKQTERAMFGLNAVVDQKTYNAWRLKNPGDMPDLYDPAGIEELKNQGMTHGERLKQKMDESRLAEATRSNAAKEEISWYKARNQGPLAMITGPDGTVTTIGGPGGIGSGTLDAVARMRGKLKEAEAGGKGVGTYYSGRYTELMQAGDDALLDNSRLDRLSSLLKNVDTGKFTGVGLEFKRALKGIGIDPDDYGIADNVAPLEAARMLSGQLAIGAIRSAKLTPMTDKDLGVVQSLQPGIEQTTAGRELIIALRKADNKRSRELQKLATEYKRMRGGLDENFTDLAQQYVEDHPLFQPDTEAQYTARKPGEWYLHSDGDLRQKQ